MKAYRNIIKKGMAAVCCALLAAACNEPQDPTNLPPTLEVTEATEVTRTSAVLAGEVQAHGTGEVTQLQFRYGTSPGDLTDILACDPAETAPEATADGLTPNTTYYFCLEAGNGTSSVQSRQLSFTTQPTTVPVMTDPTVLNQGPISITLQYEVTDDGGEPLTATGVYCRTDGGEERDYPCPNTQGKVFQVRIGSLQMQTDYTVTAYARNAVGETRSRPLAFRTEQAITLTTPGTLPEIVGEEGKHAFETMRIAGPLNGTDLRFLRDMMGRDTEGRETEGKLALLDLTDATIHAGGLSYDGQHFTEEGTVGNGLFAGCPRLREVALPANTATIEGNAFSDCPLLATLCIPAATTSVAPSDHCPSLQTIEVTDGNPAFRSQDGILYDAALTCLYWFPEGKTEAPTLPATLQSIGEYALRNYPLPAIVLPASVKKLGKSAFHRARLTTVVLPDGIENIPSGLFQECTQLTDVTLGSQTSYLADYCFDRCPLQHLRVKTENFPPMCQYYTFAGAEDLFETCTLHVPSGHRNIYRNSDYWGQFKNIVEN